MAKAYSTCDAEGCAALFTHDAQLHSPFAPPAIGRKEIRRLHQEWTATPSQKSFTLLEHGGSETLAWCLCRFSEGDLTGDGTSLLVLVRQDDGAWRIRSCCLHGDPEPE